MTRYSVFLSLLRISLFIYSVLFVAPSYPRSALCSAAPRNVTQLFITSYFHHSPNRVFLKLAAPQLVQMYIGDGAKLVRDAFDLAKEKINKEGRSGAIIFIDELGTFICWCCSISFMFVLLFLVVNLRLGLLRADNSSISISSSEN